MSERYSSIHSDFEIDDDDQLLTTTTNYDRQRNLICIRQGHETFHENFVNNEKQLDDECLINDFDTVRPVSKSCLYLNLPVRYTIGAWAFFGFFCLFALRVNLSIAIVAMVAPQSSLNQSVQSCHSVHKNSTTPPPKYEFNWSPHIQGFVLGAFFYGYITMQIIGGNLAEKLGAKWIYGGCVLIPGILTLLVPLAARAHVGLLIALRFLTGVVAGPATPSATALWGQWIPPSERSTVPPVAQSGSTFGIIVSTPLISIMIEKYFLGGWPSAFYISGMISCLWFLGWCYFSFNTPDQHPRISDEERRFLKQQITNRNDKHKKTPWKHIVRCPPVYGIAILHVCNNYIFYTLLTSLPTYFSTILNFNLQQSGFLFAVPYLAQFLVTIIFGFIADHIRARNIMSITVLRKAQAVLCTVGTCSFLFGIGYMGCNHVGAVICCIFSVAFLGLNSCGPLISPLDIASNYAGTIIGITNSLGTIPGFIGPYVVGVITNNNQTIEAWRLIFDISAGIGVLGCIAYCILFKGEEQPWNRTSEAHERNDSIISIDT